METFKEIQTARNIWTWLILLPVFTACVWGLYAQLFLVDLMATSNGTLLTLSATGCIGSLVFLIRSMKTEIDDGGITVTWRPFFIKKSISWEKIETIEVIQYNRLYEFGQFGSMGIRYGRNGLKGYLVSGEMGVLVKTSAGEKILIGTSMPRTISDFLRRTDRCIIN